MTLPPSETVERVDWLNRGPRHPNRMQLTAANAEEYLRSRYRLAPSDAVRARQLTGGVSNTVLHISGASCGDFVLKQALGQLQVSQSWFCSVERIWREIDVLRICQRLTEQPVPSPLRIETPRLLFEDRDNYLYAMSAAPLNHVVWKSELMAGATRAEAAASCGVLLGRLHADTWHDGELAERIGDRTYFDELRVDPYYRQIARVHPDLQPAVTRLIDSVDLHRHCLVHGDFSPKNLLLYGDCLMLIDFEVGHYGDPAFDLGFFLTHLVLKGFYHAPDEEAYFELTDSFWRSYRAQLLTIISIAEFDDLTRRAIMHLAGCLLARLDGKSPVDYFNDETRGWQVRKLSRALFEERAVSWDATLNLARELIADRSAVARL
jgi:5-methylthioribose kinase